MRIPRPLLDAFVRHARGQAPNEACGLLVGSGDQVHRLYLMTNADASPEHYTLVPQEQFFVIKHARAAGMRILATVHSHPATPARPSAEDIRLAVQPDCSHVIVSLAGAEPDARLFAIADGAVTPVDVDWEDVPAEGGWSASLVREQREFAAFLRDHADGDWSAPRLASKRVAMGVYEQRGKDAFMVRVRTQGGLLPAAVWDAVAQAAQRWGRPQVHLTTRGGVQIHDVPQQRVADVLAHLADAGGITAATGGNGVRGVAVCPQCAGTAAVSQVAAAVSRFAMTHPLRAGLPRKFKVAVCGCPEASSAVYTADLGLWVRADGAGAACELFSGGGLGHRPQWGVPLERRVPLDAVPGALAALLALFNAHGDRKNRRIARLRHVRQRVGDAAFAAMCREALDRAEPQAATAAAPRVWDARGMGADPHQEARAAADGTGWYLAVRPSQGMVDAAALQAVAAFAAASGISLVATADQGLRLAGMAPGTTHAAAALLDKWFPDWRAPHSRVRPIACAGTQVCKQGMCNSRDLAPQVEAALREVALPPSWPTVRISGCPNSCAAHQVAPVGLQGGGRRIDGVLYPVYDVFVRDGDGRLGRKVGYVIARKVPAFLAAVAEKAADAGPCAAAEATVADSQWRDPSDATRLRCDVGADAAFSMEGRTKGECSIGVIDVIEGDLAAARRALARFQETGDGADAHDAAVAAARALLITQGDDAESPVAVRSGFDAAFVRTGYVDPRLAPVVEGLGAVDAFAPGSPAASLVADFAAAVEQLYAAMDNRFHFGDPAFPPRDAERDAEEGQTESADDADAVVHVDLRGVPCPINFVKAKLALERIAVGHRLCVVVDDGEPVANVPASFRTQGQEVESITPTEDGRFAVTIRRVH